MRPRRDLDKPEQRNVNFRNLDVVRPSRSSQKVDVQSLNNKALSVADFVVTQGIDMNQFKQVMVFFIYLAKKVRELVVLQLFTDLGLM